MIHFSLFSGIGGFELASEWAGWRNLLSCEINEFGNKILQHYWPEAYHHTDIHTLNYDTINIELSKRFGEGWRNDDIILTGGFPCQPYSAAGKRLGNEDDRHLWPEMLRVIRETSPTWVVGENVHGIINWSGGLVFEEVQADLEALGYEVQAYVLPSASVNAPHKRERTWFVANSHRSRFQGGVRAQKETKPRQLPSPLHSREVWDAWEDNVVKPYLLGANDGVSRGLDRIKALGNAIVPQVAFQIFKAINQYNEL